MPNGYESPLNKLADALPSFIMQMQDMKMRQEAQEALASYRQTMLARQIATEKAERETRDALEDVRERMGYYEPPEVKVLRDNISYEMRTLNDPDIALTLDDEDIVRRWKKLQNMQADYFGRTERDISVSMPIPVESALSRLEAAKPPPTAAPPAAEIITEKAKPRGKRKRISELETKEAWKEIGKRTSEFVERLMTPGPLPPVREQIYAEPSTPAEAAAVGPTVEEIPPGFPDPSDFPEGQTATFNGLPWVIRNGQWVKGK